MGLILIFHPIYGQMRETDDLINFFNFIIIIIIIIIINKLD